ncbi:MAG: phosphodiester glycosidase family protein [Solirubrobacterales bacterium]|nr:phosphodiester glycosidase family protein [Solirubrobacterales bacterium]
MAQLSREQIARYEERILAYERVESARRRPARTAGERRRSAQRPTPAGRAQRTTRAGRAQRATLAGRPAQRRGSSSGQWTRGRVRRIVAMTYLTLVAIVFLSFTLAMSAPSNTPFGVRAVEWLRNNGAAWLVSDVESIYYSWTAPSTGGPSLKRLPKVGGGRLQIAAGYRPPPIAPVIHPALRGEGVWHATGPLVKGSPPVLVTTYRPEPAYPQMIAGVAWLDRSRVRLALYPGRYEPPNSGNALAEVPPQLRGRLLATFNSGFKLEDDGGGFDAFGRLYAPLKDGQATLVGFRDGSVDVRAWTGGPKPGPNVLFARQNLPLVVEGGRLNPSLSNGALWGATLGNAVRVWRSGVGVDRRGDLIYAAADWQTAQSLAQILQRAGAVRAMELDINSEWVTFNFYGAWGAGRAQKLLPGMTRPANRYLSPDDRDFFAVYAQGG